MATPKSSGLASIGYSSDQMAKIEQMSGKKESSVISGFTTRVKAASVRKLMTDLSDIEKPLKDCGKHD